MACCWRRPSNAPTLVLSRSGLYTQPLSWGLGSKPLQQRYDATRVQLVTQSQALCTHGLTSLRLVSGLKLSAMLIALCSTFCEHFCCWSDVKQVTKEYLAVFSTAVVNSFLFACFCECYSGKCRCTKGKSCVGVLLGLAPFFLVVLLLWRRNASLAGGFAGRLVW